MVTVIIVIMYHCRPRLSKHVLTIKKSPQPYVSIIFKWSQISAGRVDFFNYVVQCINGSAVGINQQSCVVHLFTVEIKTTIPVLHNAPGSTVWLLRQVL